jgi:protein gp37
MPTKIEWTDETWNPVVGCDKISPGCANCYADRLSKRFRGGVPFTTITLHDERMDQPGHWKRPRRIFVGSMTDLFQAKIPTAFRDLIFLRMILNGRHTFQVLTKRPDLALAYLEGVRDRPSYVGAGLNAALLGDLDYPMIETRPLADAWAEFWPLPNVWLGISAETQTWADVRIPVLLKTPAAVRFVSFEPLIGPIDGSCIHEGIDWCIIAAESGPNARPMNLAWARRLLATCRLEGIPYFFKQLGGWPKKRDQMEDFPLDLRVREFPR